MNVATAGGPPTPWLSVIVPVYNEAATIEAVVERVVEVLRGLLAELPSEIVICDDGSRDGTAAILARLCARHAPLLSVHTCPTNLGKGAAVRQALALARGEVVLIQDADLELDPREYQPLLAPILAGQAQVVYGSRFLRPAPGVPRLTRLANWVLTQLTNVLFGARLTDMETAYKVFRSEAARAVPLRCVRFDFEPELTARLLRAGHRIQEVPVSYVPRTRAQGKKIGLRDGWAALATLLRCRLD